MIPMLPFSPPTSVVNAYARVDKATSEFLNCPDWRINIGICDTINTKPWLAKDYIKGVRTRIQHKNPNVQLLSLTLLETIVKNCNEHIHVQMAERKILHEMIKIVKKRAHMRVREKILVLIDTWQEAFGGRGGKSTAQYYRAYEELRRLGVDFPRRSPNSVPIITPPIHGQSQSGASSSTRNETVSLSTLESMKTVLDLLSEMLQAVDLKDRKSVKDEIIVDLIEQCRSNQKKLGYTLSSTTDEEILGQGIQFNEALQYTIEKHDAIASGSPIPIKPQSLITNRSEVKQIESVEVNSKASSVASSSSSSNEIQEVPNHKKPESDPTLLMALVPSDPPISVDKKSAEEDLIDLLSLALTPAQDANQTPDQNINQTQPAVENQPYVVPWAQALTQPPAQSQTQAQAQLQMEYEQAQVQMVQQQTNYIPPPWAPTPGYYCNPYASNYSPASYYSNGSSSNGSGLNPYIPSYRLFEDLNVLGNVRTGGASGPSGPSMVRK